MKPTALVAAAAAVAVLATACSGGGDKSVAPTQVATSVPATTATTASNPTTTAAPKPTTVTIHPLFVRSGGGGPASGGVGQEVLTMAPVDDGIRRVDFSEDEVAGLGDQSRAASWSVFTDDTAIT